MTVLAIEGYALVTLILLGRFALPVYAQARADMRRSSDKSAHAAFVFYVATLILWPVGLPWMAYMLHSYERGR